VLVQVEVEQAVQEQEQEVQVGQILAVVAAEQVAVQVVLVVQVL
jgi:hypothetical protein